MAENYTYRDIAGGEAFREYLGSLGWAKPRKDRAAFTKKFGEDLTFHAVFTYATFNHVPGDYSGIPAFRVISQKWRKTLRKISVNLDEPLDFVPSRDDGEIYFMSVGHPNFHDFVDRPARMSYLSADGQLNTESFDRFNAAAEELMENFSLADSVALSEQELRRQRLDTVLPDMLGYLNITGADALRDELYRKVHANITENGGSIFDGKKTLRRRWDTVAHYFALD